jgi:hypothetical protein
MGLDMHVYRMKSTPTKEVDFNDEMRKYVIPFMEVQQKSIGEIKSLLFNVQSIETMLNNNK